MLTGMKSSGICVWKRPHETWNHRCKNYLELVSEAFGVGGGACREGLQAELTYKVQQD